MNYPGEKVLNKRQSRDPEIGDRNVMVRKDTRLSGEKCERKRTEKHE